MPLGEKRCLVGILSCERSEAIMRTDRSTWYGPTLEPQERKPPRHPGAVLVSNLHAGLGRHEDAFRYLEERIYPGDRLFVMGSFFKTPMPPREHEPEDDDPEESGPNGWPGFNARRFAAACREAEKVTPSRVVGSDDKDRPLVISAQPAAAVARMYDVRFRVLVVLSAVPIAVAVFLVWTKFFSL